MKHFVYNKSQRYTKCVNPRKHIKYRVSYYSMHLFTIRSTNSNLDMAFRYTLQLYTFTRNLVRQHTHSHVRLLQLQYICATAGPHISLGAVVLKFKYISTKIRNYIYSEHVLCTFLYEIPISFHIIPNYFHVFCILCTKCASI